MIPPRSGFVNGVVTPSPCLGRGFCPAACVVRANSLSRGRSRCLRWFPSPVYAPSGVLLLCLPSPALRFAPGDSALSSAPSACVGGCVLYPVAGFCLGAMLFTYVIIHVFATLWPGLMDGPRPSFYWLPSWRGTSSRGTPPFPPLWHESVRKLNLVVCSSTNGTLVPSSGVHVVFLRILHTVTRPRGRAWRCWHRLHAV